MTAFAALISALWFVLPVEAPCVTLRVYDDPTTTKITICEPYLKAVPFGRSKPE